MHPTDYRTLINRGRKAGLTTRELYSAISGRGEGSEQSPGQMDGNGFVSSYDQQGRRVFAPIGSRPRP